MKKLETTEQFNNKWSSRLEEGFYGLAINDIDVINLVDKHFTRLEKKYPDFTYSQIKLKFGSSRVYLSNVNLDERMKIEKQINEILDEKE